jgi:hypothetical protein
MKNYFIKYSFDKNAFDLYGDIEWHEGQLRPIEMVNKNVTWQIASDEDLIWILFTLKSANDLLSEILCLIKQNPKNIASIRGLVIYNNWLTEDQILLLDCQTMLS